MSSDIAPWGKINFEDLQHRRKYGFFEAYAQSKLANLLFAFELDRRCGFPAVGKIPPAALDRTAAIRLWEKSEELTGVTYEALSKRVHA
jgi:hypothetical protein